MSRRLYAGNLNFQITDSSLHELFSQAGGVERVEIVKDRWTGLSRGFGFIDMMTSEDAETAIAELDGAEVFGRAIRVAPARPREERAGRL
jgi:RNA recognition motif-containing protein